MFESQNNISHLIDGCVKGQRKSQEMLYRHFYGFAMSICMRYSKSREEAVEILNDSFLKVFTNLKKFDKTSHFEPWFKRILVNTSIDYYRKDKKHYYHEDVSEEYHLELKTACQVSQLQYQDLNRLVTSLPNTYKTVFNLYAIEGYSHKEIAELLSISEGTSKSNLSRARELLRKYLSKDEKEIAIGTKNNVMRG